MQVREGKATVDDLVAFKQSVPGIVAREAWSKKAGTPVSYATTDYFGVHSFYLETPEGKKPFRWTLSPVEGIERTFTPKELSPNAYEVALRESLKAGDIAFEWTATWGTDQDDIDDPGVLWPDDREQASFGQITITGWAEDFCDAFTFDPVLVSKGFSISGDPVLPMRSAAYHISFGQRISGE